MTAKLSVQAIVFDLDDTLYAERDYVHSGYQAVQEALAQMPRSSPQCPHAAQWLWGRFQQGQAAGAFDALSDEYGLGLSPAEISALVTAYRNHRPTIRPYGGAAAMLGRFHELAPLGLLSDGFMPAQQLKLDALKLGRFFDAVVFTETLGANREFWKPAPQGFEAISKQLGAAGADCAYVSDNPAKDFVAPNALGWRTIQFLRPAQGQLHIHKPAPPAGEPDTVVRSAAELFHAIMAQ